MDFFLVGFLLWFLIGAAFILFVWGLFKKDWRILLVSGVAILIPSFILETAHGLVRLLLFLPLIPLSLAYYTSKKS